MRFRYIDFCISISLETIYLVLGIFIDTTLIFVILRNRKGGGGTKEMTFSIHVLRPCVRPCLFSDFLMKRFRISEDMYIL